MDPHHHKIILTLLLCVLLISTTGCMETPDVSPAFLDDEALNVHGWSKIGDVEYRTIEQKISDHTSINISVATVKYRNDRLTHDIEEQISEFNNISKLPLKIKVPKTSSEVYTNRLTFPAGVKMPTSVISKLVESYKDELSTKNGINDTKMTGTRQITLADGISVPVHIYSGTWGEESNRLNVIGFVAAYESKNSNTIIAGFVPNGSISVNSGPFNSTIFKVDGEKELETILSLISTVK